MSEPVLTPPSGDATVNLSVRVPTTEPVGPRHPLVAPLSQLGWGRRRDWGRGRGRVGCQAGRGKVTDLHVPGTARAAARDGPEAGCGVWSVDALVSPLNTSMCVQDLQYICWIILQCFSYVTPTNYY